MSHPDELALVSADRRMTWRELEEASLRLAGGYLGLGLEPGDRIASLMPNRIELVVHYLACFKAGLVATPLNYRYTPREIDHALEVSGARSLLAHVERAEDLAASELVGALPRGTIAYRDAEPRRGRRRPSSRAASRSCSSTRRRSGLAAARAVRPRRRSSSPPGSTGPAKGVTHTHETLRWMIASAVAAFELSADDVFLPGSSMSHIGSFLWTLATLSVGGRVVVARSYDAHELLPLLREHQPTVLAMIPAALSALIRDHDLTPEDFASLRICRAGADKVSTELLTEFAAARRLPDRRGLRHDRGRPGDAQPALAARSTRARSGRRSAASSIALRDEDGAPVDGRARSAASGSGPRSRMAGYWEAPEATAEVVDDDWLDSGDLARADEDGYLWFFGRKKQVIVHDGSNISPLEVEGALVEHPAIALAGVVGIHDAVHGENVRAYVTLRPGAERPSSADLIVHCRDRIGYKAPEEVVFLDEMPLNPTGKIDRVGLKRMAEDHLHPHGLE